MNDSNHLVEHVDEAAEDRLAHLLESLRQCFRLRDKPGHSRIHRRLHALRHRLLERTAAVNALLLDLVQLIAETLILDEKLIVQPLQLEDIEGRVLLEHFELGIHARRR
jgi:hypothetical protein